MSLDILRVHVYYYCARSFCCDKHYVFPSEFVARNKGNERDGMDRRSSIKICAYRTVEQIYRDAMWKLFNNYAALTVLSTIILIICSNKCRAVEHVQLEIAQDPAYPNAMSILALEYSLISDKVVQVSAQFQINEEIPPGTKVQHVSINSQNSCR